MTNADTPEYMEPAVFIRHSGGGFLGDYWAQSLLFNEDGGPHRVAVHYQDRPSFDSDDYTYRGKRIKRFDQAGREPTIAVVSFSELPKNEKYVTRTIPDSHEILVMDTEEKDIIRTDSINPGGSLTEFPEQFQEEYDGGERYKVVKTLRVEDWKPVYQDTHKVLWDWHVPQTLHEPNRNSSEKSQYICAVYYGDNKPLISHSLGSPDEELIAEKYLREHLNDFRLDAPRGGTLSGIDLLGSARLNNGERLETILASVTSSTGENREERIEDINDYAARGVTYFFDGVGKRPHNLDERVEYVSLEEVFDWMDTDETRRQNSLYTMLGVEDPL